MKAISKVLLVGAVFIAASACSTKSTHKDRSTTAIQDRFSPDPLQFQKPLQSSKGESQAVDPLHLRTQADYHFAVGEAYSLDGDSRKAIESFKLAQVYDSQSPTIHLRLATEYVRAGQVSEALEQAEHGLQKEPAHRDLRLFIGGLYATMKIYDKALEHYKFLLTKEPKDQSVHLYVGALYADQGEIAKAEQAFLEVTKIKDGEDGKSYLAYLYLSKLSLLDGAKDYKRAETWLRKALASKPDFEEGAISIAEVMQAQDKTAEGIKLLERFQKKHGPKRSTAHHLAQHYLEAQKYSEALTHLRVLEEFDPGNLNVQMKIALILIEQKKYDEAIDRLERIMAASPDSDKVRYYLAAVYEELEDFSQAIQNYRLIDAPSSYFPDAMIRAAHLLKKTDAKEALNVIEKAVAKRGDSASLFGFYASLLDETKQYDKGLATLEAAEKNFPKNTQIMYYLGNIYDRMGKTQKTITKMREVISLDENHFHALNYLAYTLADRGQELEEAEKLALRALDLQPNDGYILDTVGWVYFKKGNYEEAIRYLEAAFKLKPTESVIAEHLGDAYYVFQLKEKAKDMYLRAVGLETDAKKLSEIRAKLSNIQKGEPADRKPASAASRN